MKQSLHQFIVNDEKVSFLSTWKLLLFDLIFQITRNQLSTISFEILSLSSQLLQMLSCSVSLKVNYYIINLKQYSNIWKLPNFLNKISAILDYFTFVPLLTNNFSLYCIFYTIVSLILISTIVLIIIAIIKKKNGKCLIIKI